MYVLYAVRLQIRCWLAWGDESDAFSNSSIVDNQLEIMAGSNICAITSLCAGLMADENGMYLQYESGRQQWQHAMAYTLAALLAAMF